LLGAVVLAVQHQVVTLVLLDQILLFMALVSATTQLFQMPLERHLQYQARL
jgi:hypothetical protein